MYDKGEDSDDRVSQSPDSGSGEDDEVTMGDSSSQEEELPKTKQSKAAKVPRRKSTEPTAKMSFEDAMSRINDYIEAMDGEKSTLSGPKKRGRPRRKTTVKLPWRQLLPAIQEEALSKGISEEDLKTAGALLSNPDTHKLHGAKLIMSMIPMNSRVPVEVVEKIIRQIQSFSEKVKLVALKYLTGLYDYDLCDRTLFAKFLCYSRIFFAGRASPLIPWICGLMKRISKPQLVQKGFINDLMDLLHTPLLGVALKAIVDLLRYFKLLRPDLLPNSVFHMSVIGTSKKLDLDSHFRESLYKAKRRFLRIEGDQSEPMETDQGPEIEKMDKFMESLNAVCFPEFQLHVTGDPDPNDIRALLMMHKFDFMRCALKTMETLPILVNDVEAMEEFNTHLSLVFQHRFNSYDPEMQTRYDFILKRCLNITILRHKGIEAVNDWLLEYMWMWDGVLFKSYVYELFRYLPPVDFSDGYIHVLQKFETFFLFGDAWDRIQVWDTLTTIATNWMIELIPSETENLTGTGTNVKEALGFLLDFIHSLVKKITTVDGHKDEVFLVNCSKSYIEMNNFMNSLPDPPFYIFPPAALWCMVVLSDSLLAMDHFCWFLEVAQPRHTLQHLRKTKEQEVYKKWNKEVLRDVSRYFGLYDDNNPVFESLFSNELKGAEDFIKDDEGLANPFGNDCKAFLGDLLVTLNSVVASKSRIFEDILNAGNGEGVAFPDRIDETKAKKLTPHLFQFVRGVWSSSRLNSTNMSLI